MTPRKTSQQGASPRARRARASARPTTRSSSAKRSDASARPKKAAKPKSSGGSARKLPGREIARHWTVPLVAAALVAFMLGASYYPAARVQYREMRQKSKLETELKGLQARNAKLRDQVARLKTPEGLEDLARTQLGLVKKGEHVAVIVDEDADAEKGEKVAAAPKLEDTVPTAAQAKDTGWTAFLDAFFGVEQ